MVQSVDIHEIVNSIRENDRNVNKLAECVNNLADSVTNLLKIHNTERTLRKLLEKRISKFERKIARLEKHSNKKRQRGLTNGK